MALKSAVVGALGNATPEMKKDSGSAGATPYNKPETSRVSANAAAMPIFRRSTAARPRRRP